MNDAKSLVESGNLNAAVEAALAFVKSNPYHRDNKGEIHSKAVERQKVVLKKFEKYYTNRAIYDLNLKFVEEGVNGKYDN